MSSDDYLERLERLARLRETGALNTKEFEREKAQLLQQNRGPVEVAGEIGSSVHAPDFPVTAIGARRRWPLWAVAGLALAGSSGWALANWTRVQPADKTAPLVNPARTGHSSAAAPELRAQPRTSAIRRLAAERQVDMAFDAVFGHGKREIRIGEEATYAYAKGRVVWAEFGPVLIVEGSGDPSPPSLGALGIFYLREKPGAKFEEVRRWPDAVTGSIMGNPPQWKIRYDLTDQPVIESVSGGVWQGYACQSTVLTELTRDGPNDLVVFDSHYDSLGAKGNDGTSYDGTISHIVRNRSFIVKFSGTQSATQHFDRKGGKYVRVPDPGGELSESAIPTC